MCRFSVVIPAYNIEEYIGKCLDSVLAQTYTDYEVIVVDDGSEDKTGQILDDYEKRYDKIKVIHKKNEGVSIARNTGIEASKGEYFCFFDGDDFMEKNTMEFLDKKLRETGADTVIYGYYRFENGKIKETCPPCFDEGIYENEAIMEKIFPKFIGLSYDNINDWFRKKEKALYVENPALWRSVVSAKIIKENSLRFNKNLKVGEDTLFISEYLTYAKKLYVEKQCFYYLVTRETSTIFIYEKKPLSKLEGKIRLMDARNGLTERIKSRYGTDITELWSGTVAMSAVEMAFLLSKKHPEYGFFKRFEAYKKYVKRSDVQKINKGFKICKGFGITKIPFVLLKMHMYFLLFIATWILNCVNYEFNR